MPGDEPITQDTVHNLARQCIGLQLRKQWMNSELANRSQQQHHQNDPEGPSFQDGTALAEQNEGQQLGPATQAHPADQREQLAGKHAGQMPIGQRRKKSR